MSKAQIICLVFAAFSAIRFGYELKEDDTPMFVVHFCLIILGFAGAFI